MTRKRGPLDPRFLKLLRTGSGREMPLDLVDRHIGIVLRQFRGVRCLRIGAEGRPQRAERLRRRNEDDAAGILFLRQFVQPFGQLFQKLGFGLILPVGLLDGAAAEAVGGMPRSRSSAAGRRPPAIRR